MLTLSQTANLDSSTLKAFADNNFNFKLDKNTESSPSGKKTLEKGGIAH